MIAAAILQSAYNDLYTQLRNYIWDYETVVKIADLEVASYKAFPDIDNIRRAYERLRSDAQTSDVWTDDDKLQKAFDAFEDRLDGADQIFYGLFVPQEVTNTDIPLAEPTIKETEDIDYEDQEELEDQFTDDNTEAE